MRYTSFFQFSALLSLSLPFAAADPRYCNNKTPVNATDFTLRESGDNSHLAALAKYFQDTGKNVSVSAVLKSANRALSKGSPPVGSGSPSEAWAWKSDDYKTKKWTPQGITSTGDALGSGKWNDQEAWIVSWYEADKNVRLSFVDRNTHEYRHVLLVNPTADDDFESITIHAGGIMWYGDILYVVDTVDGIRAFDLDNIWEVNEGEGVGKVKNGTGFSADGYKYVLPQTRYYKWTPGQTSPFRFSWISLDRSNSPDTLLIGEFVREGEKDKHGEPVPTRLVKYQLDAKTRHLKTDKKGVATASWAHCFDLDRMQGGVSYDGKFYLSVSNGRDPKAGDLYTWDAKKGKQKFDGWFMAGNEDLSFNQARKEYYTVTEYDGGRYILAYKA